MEGSNKHNMPQTWKGANINWVSNLNTKLHQLRKFCSVGDKYQLWQCVLFLAVAQPPLSSGTDSGFVSDILPCLGLEILLCRTFVGILDVCWSIWYDPWGRLWFVLSKTLKTFYPPLFSHFSKLPWAGLENYLRPATKNIFTVFN